MGDRGVSFELSRPVAQRPRIPAAARNRVPEERKTFDDAIHRVPHGRYILLPITAETHGHGTHSLPAIWGKYLGELLAATEPRSEK